MDERMKTLKLYLETSVWNFLLAEDAPEKWRLTETFFEEVANGPYELYVSASVLKEIDNTNAVRKRPALLDIVENRFLMILVLYGRAFCRPWRKRLVFGCKVNHLRKER